MAKVKCEITYPSSLISNIGEFEINYEEANESVEETGKLIVINENVDVDIMLHIVGLLFGPRNATCYMDVYVGNDKVNPVPIESKYKQKIGAQLFNWSAS